MIGLASSRRTLSPSDVRSDASRRDPVVLVGTLLVLALVALLPLALALVTASGGSDDGGVGSGTGELSAAALSALHRDLNARRSTADALPDPLDHVAPQLHWLSLGTRERSPAESLSLERATGDPGEAHPAPVGPGPDGIPLRL